MDKPDVDFIEGLSPAVSIDQKSTNRNPRSTVGTITEVYDYLRLLWARAGRPHCPVCGEPITRQTPQQIVDRLLELPEGTRFQVLAPVVRGRKGEYADLFRELQTKGFARARVDGEVHVADRAADAREEAQAHASRSSSTGSSRSRRAKRRLTDSRRDRARAGRRHPHPRPGRRAGGRPDRERRFSEKMACPNDHPLASTRSSRARSPSTTRTAPAPSAPASARRLEVDPELLVPDEDLTLAEGAIAPWTTGSADYFVRLMKALGEDLGFTVDTPVAGAARAGAGRAAPRAGLPGARPVQEPVRPRAVLLDRLRGRHPVRAAPARARPSPTGAGSATRATCARCPCPACKGARLKPESLAVLVGGQSIADVCNLPIREAARFLARASSSARARSRSPSGC